MDLTKFLVFLGVLVTLAIALVSWVPEAHGLPRKVVYGDDSWRRSGIWDDGKAEYAAYEISWPRYGEARSGRALLVAVKENWAPDLEVKADRPRDDGFDVLKTNHVRHFRTGIYDYHQMASAFIRRDDGRLRKFVSSSTEACGISTALMQGGQLTTSGYFDGDGVQNRAWPSRAWPEDALPLMLRDFVKGEAPPTIKVFPTTMTGRFGQLEARDHRLERRDAGMVETPAGNFAGTELRLLEGDRAHRFTFATEAPHTLLKYEGPDGAVYRLAKVERLAYWGMLREGEEQWWPENLR